MRKYLCAVVLLGLCAIALAVKPELGVNANLHGYRFFSPDHPWNHDISNDPVDADSAAILAFYGTSKHPQLDTSIPYTVVSGDQRKIKVNLDSAPDEGDAMLMPIPPTAPIEGGGNGGNGDSHCLVLDRDNNIIYETYITRRGTNGDSYTATFMCIFSAQTSVLRPLPWSSGDAAGLSVLAGLTRADEVVVDQQITHPLRFTVVNSKMSFVLPATHRASSLTGPDYLPMGARIRLKSSYNTSTFPLQARVILEGLKHYGMILADNGSNFLLTANTDSRWVSSQYSTINSVTMANFDLIQRGVEYRY